MVFSIRSLFIAVAIVALGVAGMVYQTPIWCSAIVTVAIVLLIAATIAASVSPRHRIFYLPFSFVGWLYFAWTFTSVFNLVEVNLPTTRLLYRTWIFTNTS